LRWRHKSQGREHCDQRHFSQNPHWVVVLLVCE
jgi:hypothetical protein